jgi:hypothetical protein
VTTTKIRALTVAPLIPPRPCSCATVLFGAYEQDGAHALFSIPEAAFEASFAIYLIVKGFRPSPILAT